MRSQRNKQEHTEIFTGTRKPTSKCLHYLSSRKCEEEVNGSLTYKQEHYLNFVSQVGIAPGKGRNHCSSFVFLCWK